VLSHASSTLAQSSLPVGVILAAFGTALVTGRRLSEGLTPRGTATFARAVSVAAIATAAEKEDLPTAAPGANDESKRVHRSQNVDPKTRVPTATRATTPPSLTEL
jgi:hypothetical protein